MLSYQSLADTNIYDSPAFTSIATQMAKGRYLKILQPEVLQVQLLEDGYVGFIRNLFNLEPRSYSYQPVNLSEAEINKRIPKAIAYTKSAMNVTNEYLWGGTVPPHFDCSGLIQAAFSSVGIWIPRDAYQQQDFTTPISKLELQAGDLIFFGLGEKANHVAMYLGDDSYIHSSGKEKGNNGLGVNSLIADGNEISQKYASEVRGFGRVTKCYAPDQLTSLATNV
ncbi:MAG: C40 family peptidase [Microcystis aeruginosa G11-01]|nr:C40 family peptidase [Microcystis aeruginosa G11-01]